MNVHIYIPCYVVVVVAVECWCALRIDSLMPINVNSKYEMKKYSYNSNHILGRNSRKDALGFKCQRVQKNGTKLTS